MSRSDSKWWVNNGMYKMDKHREERYYKRNCNGRNNLILKKIKLFVGII